MAINGYTDKMSVQPGQNVKFMVNSENGKYRTEIVRLIHGDTNPEGPGLKVEKVNAKVNKDYDGKKQEIYMGSYIKFDDPPALQSLESFSLQAMIMSTTPDLGQQALLSKWDPKENKGYGLFIDKEGCISLWIGDKNGNVEKISTGKPLMYGAWFFVGASFDAESGKATVFQEARVTKTNGKFSLAYGIEEHNASVEKEINIEPNADNGTPFTIASLIDKQDDGKFKAIKRFNGKIDRPRVASTALTKDKMETWIENPSGASVAAAWDFSKGISKKGFDDIRRVFDTSPNQIHGETVNMPTRAVTGYNWTSEEHKFVHAPEQYGAIHFHDDDLTDAGWDVDFEWTIPEDLPSGVYAAHVVSGDDEDYITFFVRPKKGKPTAKAVLILPTASYLAYANNRFQDVPLAQVMFGRAPVVQQDDMYLGEHAEYGLSTYDFHNDGTGVCFSSSLRPILNMRPKYRHTLSPSLWQFNADLHLVDWLTEKGFKFDVVTDQDVHFEGADLLNKYNVALTGSHPEYYSGPMMDAIEDFQASGGRFMYMGSNGFYWIVTFDSNNPSIMEVRKNFGNNAWKAWPGEVHLSLTGEFGTIWKHRGRAPQKIGGTGYVAQGFEISSYFRRTEDSHHPSVSWIFEGIEDEKIGDFGLVGGGAAGLELDIYDNELGTPPHAVIIASSEDHSSVYMPVAEELYFNVPGMAGDENPRVRADMVYYPTPNGGAVFSTSSISYCGSLSHNNYDNNISKLTENVLKKFISDEPLPMSTKREKVEFI
ncbi:large subunit of N,N-dimethylformamidase [Siminovitchia terrae]|uniref:Large subunit of N,N-dimethylformamidase n=1 Tax=Siminovitchia terrae TaxID=1914933 RepID=A0ABQ4L2Q1_SIMTE|nr:N,N-dimethylformamidase beta subunit family domain-containing protein [Siminovitchia terrae]GIN98141.1 large subunit of N,N-dimethylformamidase [Siminovitchia terrae]